MNFKIVMVNIVILLIIIAGLGTGVYYYNQSANFVTTDNAHIDGQQIAIAAPASGKLTEWNAHLGRAYNAGDKIGTIQTASGAAAAAAGEAAAAPGKINIEIPVNGTIVQQSVVPNSFVSPGTVLARAYDLNNLWVTANVEEKVYNSIKAGQTVDVYVDAYPGTTLTGRVDTIGQATAGSFSLLPTSNTTANYTKVAQVLPVTILMDGYKGVSLAPGMSVKVRIHI
ncbi:HlyD family secretion protein [Paenibacillus sp. y28]|uniref:HlyD family secretion protein n=1 Tax=Paenibacillus sp. y28 TaxID=3129110 RepID=UPI00301A0012